MSIPAELHSHLYGCLTVDDLYWLAARRPWRQDLYRQSHLRTYGEEPALDDLFHADGRGRERVRSYYLYRQAGDFARFQTCFDFCVAVSHTDQEELAGVLERVVAREPAAYAEYRMLFSPLTEKSVFKEKVRSLAQACDALDRAGGRTVPRLVISIPRDEVPGRQQYAVVRELMAESAAAAHMIVGLDFCAREEGYPPRAKLDFFETILADNRASPARALAILYHVGESFQDKSVESAARWVVEAAQDGAHRLGHCVALGVAPNFFAGTERQEILSERVDQIGFELKHAESLRAAGLVVDEPALRQELADLVNTEPTNAAGRQQTVAVRYDPARVERLRLFQNWAMERVRETGAIVESCPTSNLRIAGLKQAANHPLRRFVDAGLAVVLGADDPGILDTDLEREFELVRSWGFSDNEIATFHARADASRSDQLCGRALAGGGGDQMGAFSPSGARDS